MSDKSSDLGGLQFIDFKEYFETLAFERLKEIERLQADCERLNKIINDVVQQAQQQAQEARTQRAIVLDLLQSLDLPLHDWEAQTLIGDKFKSLQAECERLRDLVKKAYWIGVETQYGHSGPLHILTAWNASSVKRQLQEVDGE